MSRIGIDTGGTFTDAVLAGTRKTRLLKVPSTPGNPANAVLGALRLAGEGNLPAVSHGTTVATNALLEGKGGPAALVLTDGFKDLLSIGRQNRSEIYDLLPSKPIFPLDSGMILTARERSTAGGRLLRRISRAEIGRIIRRVKSSGAKSAAVCFLHSYANGANESEIGRALARHGLMVSMSHEVVGQFREFERCSTTYVNAYLAPVMRDYMEALIEELVDVPFGIMQSAGGTASAARIAAMPVRTLLSGPAAGVVGAAAVSRISGWERALTLDMGGTSADVSIIDGEIARAASLRVGGFPVVTPSVRIETVGAGGGSLASIDAGGALVVGPESSGADPGPACYGRSDRPTVTDANVVLGRIPEGGLLGGEFPIYPDRAESSFRAIASRMGVGVRGAAEGVIRVANAAMERAIRAVSVQRGFDPRDFVLVSFGGAGGLHACEIADALGIPAVLTPPAPGVLSAYGLLCADAIEEISHTVFLKPEDGDGIRKAMAGPAAEVTALLRSDASARGRVRLEKLVDLRYIGQSYEITIPAGVGLVRRFHKEHDRLYGYADPDAGVEVVNVRVRGIRLSPGAPPSAPAEMGRGRVAKETKIWWRGETIEAKTFAREELEPGRRIVGPCVVCEYSATTFLPPGWEARIDRTLNLLLTPMGGA